MIAGEHPDRVQLFDAFGRLHFLKKNPAAVQPKIG